MPGKKKPGPSVKDDQVYEAIRDEGGSKEKAARIANASAARGRSSVGKMGGKSGSYDDWKVEGDLTIRDVTKPVVLEVEFEGRAPDAYGGERAGFIATTKIRRSEFGVSWNGLIEAGGVAVSDTVKITLNIEVVRQS